MNSVRESSAWRKPEFYIRWLGTPLLSGIVGASIVFAYFHDLSVEAFASILVALTTLVLAAFTRQSVAKTDEVIQSEREGRRISTTLDLINQYQQVPIQVTKDISLTVHTAASNLHSMAAQIDDFKALKAEYEANPQAETRNAQQYVATVSAQAVFGNFYLNANQMLWLGLLHERLFMNNFAMSFLATYEALKRINAIVHTVESPTLERLDDMKAACEDWLESVRRQRGDS